MCSQDWKITVVCLALWYIYKLLSKDGSWLLSLHHPCQAQCPAQSLSLIHDRWKKKKVTWVLYLFFNYLPYLLSIIHVYVCVCVCVRVKERESTCISLSFILLPLPIPLPYDLYCLKSPAKSTACDLPYSLHPHFILDKHTDINEHGWSLSDL